MQPVHHFVPRGFDPMSSLVPNMIHPHRQHCQMQRQPAKGDRAADALRHTASVAQAGSAAAHDTHTYHARHVQHMHSTCTMSYPIGALPAGCARPGRVAPVHQRPPHMLLPPTCRRQARLGATHAPPRRNASTTPRRAPCRRCRRTRRPLSRPSYAPRGCSASRYLRRNESRASHRQTTARGCRSTTGCRRQPASVRSRSALARLPARPARGTNACICEPQGRGAFPVSARGSPGDARGRQVAREHTQCSSSGAATQSPRENACA